MRHLFESQVYKVALRIYQLSSSVDFLVKFYATVLVIQTSHLESLLKDGDLLIVLAVNTVLVHF